MHTYEDLKQAPAVTVIPLCVQDSFSLEIHIIDEGITAPWRFCHALELLLHVRAIRRRGFTQHFRQGALQPGNKKFCLKIDRVGKKLT